MCDDIVSYSDRDIRQRDAVCTPTFVRLHCCDVLVPAHSTGSWDGCACDTGTLWLLQLVMQVFLLQVLRVLY